MRTTTTKSRRGDCYESAATAILDVRTDEARLVHGTVWHEASGRHGHAWVEFGDTVLDRSNGNDVELPRSAYYALGRVEDVRRYTAREARLAMSRTGHYGPWEGS